MSRNNICVEPKVRNLCTSVFICGKKNRCPGTADYADEQDTADEEKRHQRRTEGSQSVYICVICGLIRVNPWTLFKNPDLFSAEPLPEELGYLNEYSLRNAGSGKPFTVLIKIITLELPKLPEAPDDQKVWSWAKFFRVKTREEMEGEQGAGNGGNGVQEADMERAPADDRGGARESAEGQNSHAALRPA
ncbi:MAG: Rpn family recombination-promoting nuclease/putative transposase [Treponema sp.]|nr:Rpn family recombination-promoting nuclease/putative transposase [Treponema sp.]